MIPGWGGGGSLESWARKDHTEELVGVMRGRELLVPVLVTRLAQVSIERVLSLLAWFGQGLLFEGE